MQSGAEMPATQIAEITPEVQMIPPAAPALPSADLRALAA